MGSGQSTETAHANILDDMMKPEPLTDERVKTLLSHPSTTLTAVFEGMPIKQCRDVRDQQPANFARLITKIIECFRVVVGEYGGELADDDRSSRASIALNCVRILTRLIPLVHEARDGALAEALFWHSDPADGDARAVPLAIALLDTIMAALFLPGFTINEFAAPPPSLAQLRQRRNAVLPSANVWAAGIGSTEVFPSDESHQSARVDVLKLLLVCLSGTMYRPPSSERIADSWMHYVCTRPTYYTAGFFLSLANVACSYDPIGWGIPYNHLLFADAREELVYVALQVLSILLEYEPSAPLPVEPGVEGAPPTSAKNVFARYLSAIAPADFPFLLDGLALLLENPLSAARTYLPGSTKELVGYQETLTLLWRVLLGNVEFRKWIVAEGHAVRYVRPALLFMLESRRDEAHLGVVHLATFMLLLLSGTPEFATVLNSPFAEATESLGRIDGCVGDAIVLVIAKLLVDAHPRLAALHECMLTVIANVSPYVKSLNAAASAKLLQLFDKFSKAKFVFAAERNHRYCTFLLEAFNNAVQYQYEGNGQLVYAIVRYADAFRRLAQLSLADANLVAAAAAKKGKSPFVPNEAWLAQWKRNVPLGTVLCLLDHVVPSIHTRLDGVAGDEERVLEFLSQTTLVGVLPVPHPILVRKYQPSASSNSWYRNFLFGVVFVRNQTPPLFYGTNVKLFRVAVHADAL